MELKKEYDNIDEYIADLKAAIAENDQCATHHYNLAQALLSKRDFMGAEESFLEAVRNSPRMAEAYVQLGGICLQRGDLDGCLRYNEEAANCRPQYAIAYSNIAFVHIQRVIEVFRAVAPGINFDQRSKQGGIHFEKIRAGTELISIMGDHQPILSCQKGFQFLH